MNVREYMHDICAQNVNTLISNEESQGDGKRKMSKEETLIEQQNKNKDLAMHMYKVLAARSKVLDEGRRTTTLRVKNILEKIMVNALEQEPSFQRYFDDSITGKGVDTKIELADATRYEMRVFMKAFPLPNSFQMNFGLQHNVPHGCAEVSVDRRLGRVEKMIIKSDWGGVMEGDTLTPTKIIPWFQSGMIKAVRSMQQDDGDPDHDRVTVEYCEKGVELKIAEVDQRKDGKGKKNSISSLQDLTKPSSAKATTGSTPTSSVTVTCIVCVHGIGLPRGMRLQHALPNREPYSSQGKQVVDDMVDEIEEGQSLYTLDACLDPGESGQPAVGFWETNFKHMTERVMDGARTFGKTNMVDPAIHVIEMMSISRHWDIPTSLIETAALWEYKKTANKLRNEAMCFKHVLSRLHGYFLSQSCPHFLLANYNMLRLEDSTWCEIIAKEIGDAITAMEEDPGRLLELTGTSKKKEKKDAVIEEGDTTSVNSHTPKE